MRDKIQGAKTVALVYGLMLFGAGFYGLKKLKSKLRGKHDGRTPKKDSNLSTDS